MSSKNSIPLPCDTDPSLPTAGAYGSPTSGASAYGVTLSVKVLKALLTHVSKDTVREHICAVRVEHEGDRSYIVATDGHRMALIEAKVDAKVTAERVKALRGQDAVCYSIPREAVERAVKVGGGWVTITLNGELVAWGKPPSKSGSSTMEQLIVPAKAKVDFPPWRQVVPKALNLGGASPVDSRVQCKSGDGHHAVIPVWGCNMSYLAQAAEFLASVSEGSSPTGIILAGEDSLSPQVIFAESTLIGGKAIAILMPMRV